MSKKVFLLLATTFLVVVAITGPNALATGPATENKAPQLLSDSTPIPDSVAPNSAELAVPPAGKPGFFIENGRFNILGPASDYYAVGSFSFWAWTQLNPGPGSYNWDLFDAWIEDSIAAGYEEVGLALMTFTGRGVRCPFQGVDMSPSWVLAGPDGVRGNDDDPIILSDVPDTRDCDGDGNPDDGPWYLLDYTDPYYQQQYRIFIHALAQHLLNHPRRDKISWIATGVGKDGENKPVDVVDKPALQAAGIDQVTWMQYVQDVIDMYIEAFYDGSGFPRIQVVTQNAPFYLSPSERRDIASYAASKRVGLSINGITADFNSAESCDSPNPNTKCLGIYDQARQYSSVVPIMFESYDYMMRTRNEFYWAMAHALDLKADYIRLSSFWDDQDNPDNRTVAEWVAKYLGKGFEFGEEEPPSIWSRLREHKNPCFLTYAYIDNCNYWPPTGNYEFYLTQLHLPQHAGVTIPVTDDGGPLNPDRVRMTGWDHSESPVKDLPWHTNYEPHDPPLLEAGLFDPSGAVGTQNQVDPGYVTRRSDQASGNFRFIFDAADRYFARSQPPAESTFKVIITVTYYDYGDDQWLLVYDGVNGPTAARVYAINDWTVRRGLAVDDFLPVDGVIDPPVYYVQKTNSKKWKVATFLIEDGNFNNLVLTGANADFYIDTRSIDGKMDGDEWIHHVDVRKVDEFIEVTPTPTPTAAPTNTPTPTPTITPTPESSPTPSPTPTPSVGTISGVVYQDINGNQQPDPGEGLAGATLTLTGSDTRETQSAADGSYSFDNLTPGATYLLSETPPPGFGEAKPVSSVAVQVPNGVFTWNFRHDPLPHRLYMPTLLKN